MNILFFSRIRYKFNKNREICRFLKGKRSVDQKRTLRNIDIGYLCLIVLLLLEQCAVYGNLYADQSFTVWEIVASLTALGAMAAGFFLPTGVSVVLVFIFAVSYLVWLATHGRSDFLEVSWLLFIPANILMASFFKNGLIRTKTIMNRLDDLNNENPSIDLYTRLGNKQAFADTLSKQSNLARRYPEKYDFSIAMFKIEFLPLVLESLGEERYSKFLLEISNTIQQQIRHEDSKFSIDMGRFIIVCPLTDRSFFPIVADRVKGAMMNMSFEDKNGQPLKLVVRAATMGFDSERIDFFLRTDDVIAALERGTETDLIAEYI